MPFKISKNSDGTYKVTNKITGKVYAYRTKDYKKLIKAIESNKSQHK